MLKQTSIEDPKVQKILRLLITKSLAHEIDGVVISDPDETR